MTCIFQRSKYFVSAITDPNDIVQPIGYSFLSSGIKKVEKGQKKRGRLVLKFTSQKPLFKVLCIPRSTDYRLDQVLKLTDIQRKTTLLSASTLDFLNKEIDTDTREEIRQTFAPNFFEDQKYHVLEVASLLTSISKENLFSVQDYTLSNYFFYMHGVCQGDFDYVYEMFNRQLLEYPIEGCFCHKEVNKRASLNFPQPSLSSVQSRDYVEEQIKHIKTLGKSKDSFFRGIHLFIALNFFQTNSTSDDLFKQQLSFLPYLQYYVTLMTGILAQGHLAVIPLRGTFRQKTNELIFLLKMIFKGKLTLVKPVFSNIFNCQKFIVCEDYSQQAGLQVHEYLMRNYNVLKDFKEEKLLLNPSQMLKEDFQIHITNFNDIIINKGFKAFLKDFRGNSNLKVYPPKDKILERMETLSAFDTNLANYVRDIIPEAMDEELNPDEENNQQGRQQNRRQKEAFKIVQKEADLDILNSALNMNIRVDSSKQKNPKRHRQSPDREQGSKNKKKHRDREVSREKQQTKVQEPAKSYNPLQHIQRRKEQKLAQKKKNKSKAKRDRYELDIL